MTMFDEYPEDGPRGRARTCCDGLAEMPRVTQFLHVLGHSRIPFTAKALADLSGDGNGTAIVALADAITNGWIAVVEPEQYMDNPTGLYVGQLNKRR